MQSNENQDLDLTVKPGDTLNRLRELFDAAIELPTAARKAWLAAHVADAGEREALHRLLAADDGDGFLDTPAPELVARLMPEEISLDGLIGRQIGGFQITRALGQGGMAAVFLGERVGRDFTQRVAIKLLRRGLYSALEQRLFLRERQVLAALQHPNIARLIDGGLTEAGIPYLVLEFIDGVPITDYASSHRMDLQHQLNLFLAVCRAVEEAHRNLIVHRDIKPSNILVTESGEVKLLDFGIAKLIAEDSQGATGTMGVFTPEYAAPEQIHGGAITTATDVYGLGVLLHELLLGLRPVPNGPDSNGPRRPSSRVSELPTGSAAMKASTLGAEQLRRVLRGDLDNILLKALDAEPGRRYASAGAFADDIERHLHGRPVVAHPPTRWYRTRKFIRRHRGGVTVTAVLVVAVLAMLGLALWQANVAHREQDRAESVLDFLLDVFAAAAPGVADANAPTLRDVVSDGQLALAHNARLSLDAKMSIGTRLVDVQREIGDLPAAKTQALLLIDEAVKQYGAHAAITLQAARALAQVDIDSGKDADAVALVDRYLDLTQQPRTPLQARLLALGAEAKSHLSRSDNAIADARQAIAWCIEAGCDGQVEIDVNETLAEALQNAQQYDEAEQIYKKLLVLKRQEFGNEHAFVASTLEGLASTQMKAGRFAEAEKTAREGIAIAERVYVRPHNALASHYQNLGILYFRQEKFDAAKVAWDKTLDIQSTALPQGHRDLEATLNNLGTLELARESFAAAVPLLQRTLDSARARGPSAEADYAVTARNLGGAMAYSGDFAKGRALIEESIAIRTRRFGAPDGRTLGARSALAAILVAHGDTDAALAETEAILTAYAQSGGADADAMGQVETYRGEALMAAQRNAEAATTLRGAIGRLSQKPLALRTRARATLDLAACGAQGGHDTSVQQLRNDAAAALARLSYQPPSLIAKLAALDRH